MRERRPGRRAHGELESQVMAAVVAAGAEATVRDVLTALDGELSYTAVHTTLNRLVDKGLVERTTSERGHGYRPATTAAGVLAEQMDALLHRGPSSAAVLRSFLGTLSEQDEAELRRLLAARDEPSGA